MIDIRCNVVGTWNVPENPAKTVHVPGDAEDEGLPLRELGAAYLHVEEGVIDGRSGIAAAESASAEFLLARMTPPVPSYPLPHGVGRAAHHTALGQLDLRKIQCQSTFGKLKPCPKPLHFTFK